MRQKTVRYALRVRRQPLVDRAAHGGGLGRDVADHVAAGAQRRDHGPVDLGDRGFQVVLDDAVELDRLPGRDAQRMIRAAAGKIIQIKILPCCQSSRRDTGTDHEFPLLFRLLLLQLGRGVAVVSLIGPVELQQIVLIFTELYGIAVQGLFDAAAKQRARLLDALNLGRLGGLLGGRGEGWGSLTWQSYLIHGDRRVVPLSVWYKVGKSGNSTQNLRVKTSIDSVSHVKRIA